MARRTATTPKVILNFPTSFSKGFWPKGAPQRAPQQADQTAACANETDKIFLVKRVASTQNLSQRLFQSARVDAQKGQRKNYTELPCHKHAVQGGAHKCKRNYDLLRLELLS